nr:MAG TPA: hypothetical protein [Caudoviricetes sp.]
MCHNSDICFFISFFIYRFAKSITFTVMDELIKKRYELIIGISALFISLSAFQKELESIIIDFSFFSFSAKQYLLCVIIAVFFSASLYSLKYLFYDKHYKILDYAGFMSIFIFSFILLSPTIIALILLIKFISVIISDFMNTHQNSMYIFNKIAPAISSILGIISTILSIYSSKLFYRLMKKKQN